MNRATTAVIRPRKRIDLPLTVFSYGNFGIKDFRSPGAAVRRLDSPIGDHPTRRNGNQPAGERCAARDRKLALFALAHVWVRPRFPRRQPVYDRNIDKPE